MTIPSPAAGRARAFLLAAAAVCLTTAGSAQAPTTAPTAAAPDIQFMAGMIPHHAQAVKIARWVPTHGASAALQRLAERIVVGQSDEIALIQTWLRDRNLPVPPADATHHMMKMEGGAEHAILMPGMLSDEELARLDAARGTEFDRLFLTFMIRHHEGAIRMVDTLFRSDGAGQDEVVFRFASDVYADQTTEVDRMQKMLAQLSN